jgi:hypothetical protein
MATPKTTAKRPTTCGEMFVTDPALGAEGCKRLPRHGGEHRGHLTARAEAKAARAKAAKAAAPKAAQVTRKTKAAKAAAAPKATLNAVVRDIRAEVGQPRGRLNAAKRRAALGHLYTMVESGRITASDALGLVTRF